MHCCGPGVDTHPGPMKLWLVLFHQQPSVLFCHTEHRTPYMTRSTGAPAAGQVMAALAVPSGWRWLGCTLQFFPHTGPVQGASREQSMTCVWQLVSTSGPVMAQAPAREASVGV